MKVTPSLIATSLIETLKSDSSVSADEACDGALIVLKRECPGCSKREFLKLVERKLKREGASAAGLLVVPHAGSITAEHIAPLVSKKAGKTVHIDRSIDKDLIGGAVLLVEHRRIDSSVQGALHDLLQMCLEPLH